MPKYLRPALVMLAFAMGNPVPGQTVESAYKGLSSGALRHARLVDLLADTLMRSGGVRVTQQPILTELRTVYAGKCSVLFVQVTENQVLAARYGIQAIPVRIFYNKDGNEVFRPVGCYAKGQLVKRLAAVGVR